MLGHYEGTWSYPATDAARDGRGLHPFARVNPGAAQAVNGGNVRYGMAVGERVLVAGVLFGVRTAASWGLFDVGYVDAAGNYHRLSAQYYVYNGQAPTGRLSYNVEFVPPLLASWNAGARAVTVCTLTSADQVEVEMGWDGWREPE